MEQRSLNKSIFKEGNMSLENDLQQERVMHLDVGSFTVVESGTTVKATVETMRAENRNCAIITKDKALVGIFTDRDSLNKVVNAPNLWAGPIDAVMTESPIAVNKNDPAYQALDLMDEKHFRNVPVVNDAGQVVGNLTHYAIIKYLADRFPESIYNQPPDPNRVSRNRDGA
jgi:signal-transduction protein with cAMP-binding, CBS, and nucleotidyltransferase domain